MTDMFLGETYDYWWELKRRVEEFPGSLQVDHLLKELISANAKVRYYELQIERMNEYRKAAEK